MINALENPEIADEELALAQSMWVDGATTEDDRAETLQVLADYWVPGIEVVPPSSNLTFYGFNNSVIDGAARVTCVSDAHSPVKTQIWIASNMHNLGCSILSSGADWCFATAWPSLTGGWPDTSYSSILDFWAYEVSVAEIRSHIASSPVHGVPPSLRRAIDEASETPLEYMHGVVSGILHDWGIDDRNGNADIARLFTSDTHGGKLLQKAVHDEIVQRHRTFHFATQPCQPELRMGRICDVGLRYTPRSGWSQVDLNCDRWFLEQPAPWLPSRWVREDGPCPCPTPETDRDLCYRDLEHDIARNTWIYEYFLVNGGRTERPVGGGYYDLPLDTDRVGNYAAYKQQGWTFYHDDLANERGAELIRGIHPYLGGS